MVIFSFLHHFLGTENDSTSTTTSPLHTAIDAKNYTLASNIIATHPSLVEFVDELNDTPLQLAIRDLNAPHELIHNLCSDFSIKRIDEFGDCILHEAIEHDNYQILPLLVENGANINYQNPSFEWTPLYSLFRQMHNLDPSEWKPYYKCLTSPTNVNKLYFDPNRFDYNDNNDNTILGLVLEFEVWDILEYLLTVCHANTKLSHCGTSLPICALTTGKIPINLFEIMLHNWDARSCSKKKFFQTALEYERFDIAEFLISTYPEIVNLSPRHIGTPLYCLTFSADDSWLETIPFPLILSLINRESLLTQMHGRTPFQNALLCKNTFMIKLLIPLIPSEQLKFLHKYIFRTYKYISLQYLSAFAIRHALQNNAYHCLHLPPILIDFIKTFNIEHIFS